MLQDPLLKRSINIDRYCFKNKKYLLLLYLNINIMSQEEEVKINKEKLLKKSKIWRVQNTI